MEDLIKHQRLGMRRHEKGDVYQWEFFDGKKTIRIDPNRGIVVNNGKLLRRLGVKGMGLIYSSMLHASEEIESGQLIPVLQSYMPAKGESIYLYFTKANRNQPKMKALVESCEFLRKGN